MSLQMYGGGTTLLTTYIQLKDMSPWFKFTDIRHEYLNNDYANRCCELFSIVEVMESSLAESKCAVRHIHANSKICYSEISGLLSF